MGSELRRYPPTSDRSLTVYGAADRLLLSWASEQEGIDDHTHTEVYHDRFGALTLSLSSRPRFIYTFHSQLRALRLNAGGVAPATYSVLDPPPPTELALLRIPKSLELWELYLARIAASAGPTTRAVGGFMTRHFSPRMLEVAERYAAGVSQSRASRKARLLLLHDFHENETGTSRQSTGPAYPARVPTNQLLYGAATYRQYPGVFSGRHIDYATQFLLEQWGRHPALKFDAPQRLLDIACGNGIIGNELLSRYPDAHLLATDDSVLAVASARLNLPPDRATVLFDHTLDELTDASVDLAIINPPFHFGYETNIEVSLGLFAQAWRVLRPGGHLVVVANRHLNYATHLGRKYVVTTVTENDKYVIYRCLRHD